jgi:hypothetical protein
VKIGLILVYVMLVVWGAALIAGRRYEPMRLVATRDLPANHLVQAGDLALAVDNRQYIRRSLDKGERIDANKIATAPDLGRQPERVSRTLTVSREQVDSGFVDAGAELLLCPPTVSAEVRATICGDVGPCIAVVDVAEAAVAKLTSGEMTLNRQCE